MITNYKELKEALKGKQIPEFKLNTKPSSNYKDLEDYKNKVIVNYSTEEKIEKLTSFREERIEDTESVEIIDMILNNPKLLDKVLITTDRSHFTISTFLGDTEYCGNIEIHSYKTIESVIDDKLYEPYYLFKSISLEDKIDLILNYCEKFYIGFDTDEEELPRGKE